ncbi:MAG: hypothetical protein JNL98_04405 [Bryobacterales bacterium]|nr:hypothetical protein [Bryobacterales bacterium]
MPTAVEFMKQYRNLKVSTVIEDPVSQTCRPGQHVVELKKYFMMDWGDKDDPTDVTEEERDYHNVTSGSGKNEWFKANKERIKTAAMGKGAPVDYELALEWAARSGKIRDVTQASLQQFCDDHLGIDCSGFVTNFLCVNGKRTYSAGLLRGTNAASYFQPALAVNDPSRVMPGDLLVWMKGNSVKRSPGHIAVVESYSPQCHAGGNMRVVEATGNSRATPKLLDSMYSVERIIPKGGDVPVMILVVKRHGRSGDRVAVIRV